MSFLASVLLAAALQNAVAPIVVATLNADFNNDGRADVLQLILTKGVPYVDDELWCGASHGELKYDGRFVLRVQLAERQAVETDLNTLLNKDELAFIGQGWQVFAWPLTGDGRLQFTLGQYGNCSTWAYHVFGIDKGGKVSVLSPEFDNGDFDNSTKFIHPTGKGFVFLEHLGWGEPGECVEYLWNRASGSFVRGSSQSEGCDQVEDEGNGPGAT